MATTEAIRNAIAARLLTVPGLGVLHLYERYAVNDKDFRALFMWQPPTPDAPQELRGWFIRRLARRTVEESSTSDQVFTDWQIRGFVALEDAKASELVADAITDRIIAAIKADLSLGGLLDGKAPAPRSIGAQLVESGPFKFGGVVCHGIRLNWTTAHMEYDAPEPGDVVGDFRIFHANWDIPPHGNVLAPLPADDTADATDHIVIPE
ncbi:hypothetical protein GXW78_11930 [Roseomonas terrae]|uniref:Uncharacterized protein n=1 Tax=Neoroseomonas terrae TaxID=424799 RepID=A0ABS5EHD2_9PROT|nr:hypothetical protein [Neoroseomonas terrae]MBR0650375.1 hypothetical protein [Neoroseomonas terrae]